MKPVLIRVSDPADAAAVARFAEASRVVYERYSPVFWRRARGARQMHEPYLAGCMQSDEFAAFSAEQDGELVGAILASRRPPPPPFQEDPEPGWWVDDFVVIDANRWTDVGRLLLERVAVEAAAAGASRVVVVSAVHDQPKRAFLLASGHQPAAYWYVRPLEPLDAPAPELGSVRAIITAPPAIYDPGGPVALALALHQPADVALFARWAAASGAVLAVVPTRASETAILSALARDGFERTSEWLVATLAERG